VSIFITKSYSLNNIDSYPQIKKFNGCGGLVVMIGACGALDPGSISGRGPIFFKGF
tara:strand:+ start:8849 stop:9016 length:168 start_codon:yes stop_codon:yes gene_type:complete